MKNQKDSEHHEKVKQYFVEESTNKTNTGSTKESNIDTKKTNKEKRFFAGKTLWPGLSLIAVSWFSWWAFSRSIKQSEISFQWLVPVCAFTIYLIVLGISCTVMDRKRVVLLLGVVSFIGYFIFVDFSLISIIAFVVSVAILFGAIERAFSEKKNAIKIRPTRFLRLSMGIMISAVCLLLATGYYGSISNGNSKIVRFEPQVTEGQAQLILNFLGKVVPDQISAINKGTTVDEYLTTMIENQTGSNFEDSSFFGGTIVQTPEVIELEKRLQEELVLREGRQSIAKQFGLTEVSGDETMFSVFRKAINKRIADFFSTIPQAGTVAPIVVALAFFITIKTLGAILKPLINLLVSVLLWLLTKAKLVQIGTEMKEVEYIK